jgi:RNA polymerase sigma-70 factor (ECF subfamily)
MGVQQTSEDVGARAHSAGGLSRDEFARSFHEHSRLFWCVAVGVLGDRSRASDVVQDAAVVGLARLSQFQPGTSFQAWMAQIVRFVALNEARKMRPASTPDETLNTAHGRAPLADHTTPAINRFTGGLEPGQEAFDDDVSHALQGLDDTARACLLMKTVLDLPYARISEVLGIPEGTAMSHVHRARAAMRATLLAGEKASPKGGAR